MPWPDFQLPPNSIINTASIESCNVFNSAGSSAVYPSAQFAIYVPWRTAQSFRATKGFWYNGAAVAGTVDFGVYNTDFLKIASTGPVTQAGTNTIQSEDLLDRFGNTLPTVGGDLFFWGIVLSDATTATLSRASLAAELMAAVGCFQQAVGAATLPATATPAHCTQSYFPAMGLLVYPRTVI